MLLASSALLLGLPAAAASASPLPSGTGWIQDGPPVPEHLSVDVYLYSFGDSSAQIVLHHVSYGTVSVPWLALIGAGALVALVAGLRLRHRPA